mgnify:FL=1
MSRGKLNSRVALVTGAASGIGREIAMTFAREGASIVLFDLSSDVINVERELKDLGADALSVIGDAKDRSDVVRAVNEAINKFGKIDILVNNVGIYPVKSFLEMGEDEWDLVMSTNLKSTFLFTRFVAPYMVKQRYGRIINIASIAGTVVGFANAVHYSTSKAAILGFTRALALELAPYGITVNAIAPGYVETPGIMKIINKELYERIRRATPIGRWGRPQDVAYLALFLASDEASFITGALIVIDGGFTIH